MGILSRLDLRTLVARSFTEHPVLKTLSLLLAISIWATLQTRQVIDRPARAQVGYHFPEGLTPVDDVARTLVVTVRGPQGRVRALEGGALSVDIDLSDQESGKVSVDFSERSVKGLPDGLGVVQISPPGVELQLDKEISRIVRVKAAVIGEPPDGWERGAITVEPTTVEIKGPLSLVRNIAEVSTDIVDISGARKDQEKSVGLAIDRRTVRAVDQKKVKVTVSVNPILQARTFNEVPVLVRAPGWRSPTAAARVTLEGPKNVVTALRPDQISVQLHLPDIAVDPDGGPVEVTWRADADDGSVEIVHQGPKDTITIQGVRPATFQLEPEPGE